MIRSLLQIDFIHAGGSVRLLSVGDGCDKEPFPAMKQSASEWSEGGGEWGGSTALGGATGTVGFSGRRYHESHAALRDFCMLAAGMFPSGRTGTLRIAVSGGATWEMADSVLTASAPAALVEARGCATIQSFSITGSRPVPVTPITLFPGIPVEFILQAIEDLDAPIEDY